MREIFCSNCAELFTPSSRHRNQYFCMKPQCRKARKASLQREKMKTDPDYRADPKLSNRKWSASRPDYWREYRKNNPDRARQNRMLQVVRDKNRRPGKEAGKESVCDPPAKTQASGKEASMISARFWLIPMSPKGAPVEARIVIVSGA